MTEIGEIPKEWEVKKLGDVVEVISGATPKTNINEYWDNGDIYWATPTDITSNGKYIYKTEKSITESGLKNCSAKLLPIGSILMSSRATIGERCINNVPMATNQGFKSLVCKSEVNNEFIYYYVDILKERLIGLASGSTFLEVSKKVVEDIKIAIPNLKEQEKIALILSTVDEQIDNVDALIEKNKELKKGLMQTLLTKGIGHTKFKKTEIGEIPEEWHWGKLSNYVELKHGYQFRKEDFTDCGVPIVKISQISMRGKLELKDLTYISSNRENDFKDIIIKNGDILLALSGATVGKVALVKDLNGIYLQNYRVGKLICNDSLVNEYVFHYINSEIFYEQLMKLTNTSAQPNFGKQDMDKILITVPSKKEQQKIASILSKVDEKIDMYENKKQKLEELKKGLMQQLLTGKIRVI